VSGVFDPAALHNLEASLDDDSAIVEVDADELRRISSAESRRRCGSLKLAARIIGVATATSSEMDDGQVLASMQRVLERLSSLRQIALKLVEVERGSPDFPAVFNSITSTMLDAVTEEWKWGRLLGDDHRVLSASVIEKLLESVFLASPERFDAAQAGVDVSTVRRLAVLDVMPKLYGLVNMFDYFQASPQRMVERLLSSVVQLAEFHAGLMTDEPISSLVGRSVLQRMYGVSAGLMCEVFKAEAAADVARLRELQPDDRSFAIAQHERLGGMAYDHVLERHRETMDRMLDTANLILESRQKPRQDWE